MARTFVNEKEEVCSYSKAIEYNITMTEILALINASESCQQFIKWECKASFINNRFIKVNFLSRHVNVRCRNVLLGIDASYQKVIKYKKNNSPNSPFKYHMHLHIRRAIYILIIFVELCRNNQVVLRAP